MAGTRSLTGRALIRQILNAGDIDAPMKAMNINASDDEFASDTPNAQEVVSVSDSSEDGGSITLYYLGEVPPADEQE